MTPAEIIKEARAEGITLALSDSGTIKVRGDRASVSRWLVVIQKQKPGIVVALREAATDGPKVDAANIASASHGWLIHYAACDPVEVYCSPAATHAEVLAAFAGSVAALPDPGNAEATGDTGTRGRAARLDRLDPGKRRGRRVD